jgi:signal transduction histidine kinase
MKYTLSTIILLFGFQLTAQNKQKVDSLIRLTVVGKQHDTIRIKAYNDLGIEYAPINPILSKDYINKALKLAVKTEKPRGIAGAYNCLGIVDYYQKNYDSAIFYFQKALKINEEVGHLWGQAAALNQIGAVQNLKDDYNNAIESFQQASDIFKKMKDSLGLGKSIQNIGLVYSRMSYHKKAVEYYLEAIKIYEEIHNTEGVARSYFSIGVILNKQKEYYTALEYLNLAFPKVKEIDDKSLLSAVLKNKGISYRGLKDYSKALNYFQEALEYKKGSNNNKTMALIQSDIGITYYDMELYDKALEYQKVAVQNYELASENNEKASMLNAIAKSFIEINQFEEANFYVLKALEIAQNIKNLKEQKTGYHTLAMIAQREGESKKALELYIKFQNYSDSLSVKEQRQQELELRTIYETEKRDLEIGNQKASIGILNLQNKNKTQLLIFGSIVLLVLFGAIMFYRSFLGAKKRELAQQHFSQELIKTQEQERTRIAKDLHDGVGQQITLIKMKAQNTDQTELSGLAHDALEEVRSISRDLYPVTLAKLGLTDSIEQLLLELDEETDLFVSVEIDDVNAHFDETESLNFYRFIQESVNNVLKHAQAKTLLVNILKQSDGIKILIKDNGQGFEVSEKVTQNSLGLKTMAERISMLKGSFAIKSIRTEGTSILVQIPL